MSPSKRRSAGRKAARRRPVKAKAKPARSAKPKAKAKPARSAKAKATAKPARSAKAKATAKPARSAKVRAPALSVVRRPEPRPRRPKRAVVRPKAFAGAIASASAKDLALFDLVRARVELQAAFQGMTAASADVPISAGKWSPRQVVLHVYYWDREMLPWIEKAYQQAIKPPHTMDDILEENESSQRELGGQDWEAAKRLLQQARESLLESLQSLPEEPAEIWTVEHPLGWLVRVLSKHDRHHAGRLKEARESPGETRRSEAGSPPRA